MFINLEPDSEVYSVRHRLFCLVPTDGPGVTPAGSQHFLAAHAAVQPAQCGSCDGNMCDQVSRTMRCNFCRAQKVLGVYIDKTSFSRHHPPLQKSTNTLNHHPISFCTNLAHHVRSPLIILPPMVSHPHSRQLPPVPSPLHTPALLYDHVKIGLIV